MDGCRAYRVAGSNRWRESTACPGTGTPGHTGNKHRQTRALHRGRPYSGRSRSRVTRPWAKPTRRSSTSGAGPTAILSPIPPEGSSRNSWWPRRWAKFAMKWSKRVCADSNPSYRLARARFPASWDLLPNPRASRNVPWVAARSTSPHSATLPFSARAYSQVMRLWRTRSCHPSDTPTKPAERLSQIPRAGLVDAGVIDLVQDAVADREPGPARMGERRACAALGARGPARRYPRPSGSGIEAVKTLLQRVSSRMSFHAGALPRANAPRCLRGGFFWRSPCISMSRHDEVAVGYYILKSRGPPGNGYSLDKISSIVYSGTEAYIKTLIKSGETSRIERVIETQKNEIRPLSLSQHAL